MDLALSKCINILPQPAYDKFTVVVINTPKQECI